MRLRAILAAAVSLLLFAAFAQALPSGSHVVISEVQTRGSAGAGDEFVELLNPTCGTVDLSGWTIAFRSSGSVSYTTRATIPSGVLLATGQHYLVVGAAFSGAAVADLTLLSGITDAGVVRLSDSVGNVVDGVGYYIDASTETAVAAFNLVGTPVDNAPHDNTNSITSNVNVGLSRKGSGTQNVGDNAFDFASAVASNPESSASAALTIDCSTGVGGNPTPQALAFALAGENPFRRHATLACTLPHAARVRIEVFSVEGRRRATLVDRDMAAGTHLVPLDLGDAGGTRLGPGVYQVRLSAGGEQRSVRVVALD